MKEFRETNFKQSYSMMKDLLRRKFGNLKNLITSRNLMIKSCKRIENYEARELNDL